MPVKTILELPDGIVRDKLTQKKDEGDSLCLKFKDACRATHIFLGSLGKYVAEILNLFNFCKQSSIVLTVGGRQVYFSKRSTERDMLDYIKKIFPPQKPRMRMRGRR